MRHKKLQLILVASLGVAVWFLSQRACDPDRLSGSASAPIEGLPGLSREKALVLACREAESYGVRLSEYHLVSLMALLDDERGWAFLFWRNDPCFSDSLADTLYVLVRDEGEVWVEGTPSGRFWNVASTSRATATVPPPAKERTPNEIEGLPRRSMEDALAKARTSAVSAGIDISGYHLMEIQGMIFERGWFLGFKRGWFLGFRCKDCRPYEDLGSYFDIFVPDCGRPEIRGSPTRKCQARQEPRQ